MKEQSRACSGEAEEVVAVLPSKDLTITSTAKFFQFWHLGALHAGRCAQAATMAPVTVATAAARAAPR
jgi:hypothetical protein